MGKQSNKPTQVSQEQYDKDLNKSLEILHNDGASDQELVDYTNDYKSRFIVEKKNPNGTVSTQKKSGELAPKNGSLGTPKMQTFKGFDETNLEKLNKPQKSIPKEMTAEAKAIVNNPNYINNYKEFKRAELDKYQKNANLNDADVSEIQAELNAKKNNEGFFNKAKTALTSVGDYLTTGFFSTNNLLKDETKEARETLLKQGIKKPTPEQVSKLTDEIYLKKRTEEVKNDKTSKYISSLDPTTKIVLKADAEERFTSLPKQINDITNRIQINKKKGTQLVDDLKNPNISEEEKKSIEEQILGIGKELDSDFKKYTESKEKLGSTKDEFNALKRNYDALDNFGIRAMYGIQDLGTGLLSFTSYMGNLSGNPLDKLRGMQTQEIVNNINAEKQKTMEEFRPEVNDIESFSDFAKYTTDLLGTQSGTLLAMATTGGIAGATTLGVGQAGQKYNEMYNENKDGKTYSPLQMAVAPLLSGVSTAVLSEFPTAKTLQMSKRAFMSAVKDKAGKEIVDEAIKSTSKKVYSEIAKNYKREISTELLDNWIQNTIDKDVLGKNVGYFDNTWKTLKDTALLTTMFSAGAIPQVTADAFRLFSNPESKKTLEDNGKKIVELSKQLDNQNLDSTTKKVIENQIDKATKESSNVMNSTLENIAKLPDNQVKEIIDNDKRLRQIEEEAKAVKENESIDVKAKMVLLDGLKKEYASTQEKSNQIINEQIQTTTTETEQKAKVQEQAETEKVVSESNNNQISEPTENVDSQEIVTEIPNSNQIKKPTIVVHGAVNGFGLQYAEGIDEKDVVAPKDGRGFLPQEQQKLLNEYKSVIEKDVVLEDGNKSISIITPSADNFGRSATNTFEFVIPKGNKSTTKGIQSILDNVTKSDLKGKEVIDESVKQVKEYINSNETASPSNIEPNADVRPSVEQLGEVANQQQTASEIDTKESVQSTNDIRPTEGKTQVNYALEQIDKGILQWSGDINSPRIDLGMSWADIRKGEADLKRGKTDSVPAKRLLDAFENAKKEGGYRYKMGTDSENKRSAEFVTFEDLQRATNEVPLTDAEIEEINQNEEKLVQEYYNSFDKLTEEEQNEILENYEGKTNESTKVGENTKIGNSKNDVSNEEETARNNEFKKAIKNIPESGNIKKYLSGETIAENYGNPENAQEYDAKVLVDLSKHGLEVISKAKELFGEKYIEKTLEFLEDSDLNTFEKAIQYVALMNEIDMRLQADPNNLSDKKLQKLVYAKYQANARIGSLTINVGRLMSIMKYGIDPNRQAEKLLTSKQKEAKLEIEKIIQVTPEQINEFEDSANDEIEKAISEGVEKKINEIYSKLPTSRRIKADKAITALENIQKKLRGKAYDATIGVPIAIIDSSITVIKSAIKAGVNIADAIELGINHIKEKYGKEWTKEDEFRKDMFAGFKAEGVDTSKVEKSIKDTVKELLIEAGFSREVKSKGETKVFFDWKKLAGEEGSVDKIKENVENVLKSKGYSESEIKETSKSFEDEYNRLSEEIINKGLAELENRNLIKPSPNRKLEAKRLAELYNYGLMESESVKYDNIMNKVLGLSDLDAESYRKIKNATKALADIFNSKRTQGKLTEQAVGTLANQINHQIKVILQTQAFRNGPKRYKIASMASELAGLAQKGLLQNPGNAIENVLSGVYASIVSRGIGKFKKELTPEMRKQNKQNAKIVFDDINSNAGLFYGDTNTSLISESRIEEWLNGKSDNRVYHAILSALNGRMYLEATDSMIKSDITNSYFAKNVIEILTNKSNPEGAMTREEALKYVSDNTTGVKFEEALKEAKRIVDEINSKQEEKQLADSPQAIHRFAMDIVRDNIISGGRMTQEQVEKSYIAGYKSAGRDIGHVANNWVSKSVGFLNSNLQTSLENAVKEKDWDRATLLSLTSIITKNIMNPFVGGGTNWVVRNVTKAGLANPLSIVNIISDYAMKKEIDLSTETGRKNLEEALYRKANLQSTTASALVGTVITMLIFAGLKANDDEGLLTLDQWLKENEWAKKYFDKLSPESATMLIALEDEKLGQHYIKSFGMKTDIFDENLILLKSLDKEDSSTLGIGASIVASPFTTPGPWRMYRDIQNIKRGLNGIPPIKSDPKITGFWNGVFKGGFVDYLGYRPEAKYGTKEEIEFFRNQEKYSKEFLSTIDEKNAKSKENALKSIQNNIEKLKELKYAKRKGFKIYYNSPTEKIETKDISNEKINKYIEECKKAIKEVENRK